MLAPTDTRLLSEALQPPRGYELGQLVVTTYTLDLVSLLAVPLAFTSFPTEDGEGRPTADPLLLLEGLRRAADKITVFCQSGCVAVPAAHGALHVFVEESVVQVTAPADGGVFHPKVWVARFDGETESLVRLICLSRNLTADRSRDTILVLDGTPSTDGAAEPLAAFVDWLADAAARAGSPRVAPIRALASRLRQTAFVPADGFATARFHPLGIDGYTADPITGRRDRMLIVSPFLGATRLRQMAAGASRNILVSRPEEIAALPGDVSSLFSETLVLSDEGDPEAEDVESAAGVPGDGLRGLHAKLYVADAGRTSRVWVGSANATRAAAERNVELLVELEGPKNRVGIDRLLGTGSDTGLRSLLRPFVPHETEPTSVSELEWILRDLASAIAQAGLAARVVERGDAYDLELSAPDGWVRPWTDEARIRCRPITLSASRAVRLDGVGGRLARFIKLPVTALSAFFAVDVSLRRGRERGTTQFVARWPLLGAPANRTEKVILSLLDTPERVLAFLRLMLAQPGGAESAPGGAILSLGASATAKGIAWDVPTEPLFEALVRAVEEDPARLDPIARLVDDLSASEDGRARLPDGFLEIWEPIDKARAAVLR